MTLWQDWQIEAMNKYLFDAKRKRKYYSSIIVLKHLCAPNTCAAVFIPKQHHTVREEDFCTKYAIY